VNLFAQAPFRAQAHAVADDAHAHHELGVNGGAADGAVEGLQSRADALKVKKAVDAA
jgi:hypothetical protein